MRTIHSHQLISSLLAIISYYPIVVSCELFCSSNWGPKEEWSFKLNSKGGRGSIGLMGDVNDVLQGVVHKQVGEYEWDLGELENPVGLGAGDVSGHSSLKGLGEAILLNGHAFVRTTDNGSANYFTTESSKKYRSPFSVLVLEGCTPDATVEYYSQNSLMPLNDFFARVNRAAGGLPYCYAGFTEFREFEGIAVSKAPIFREPLFGNIAAGYYTKPPFHLNNQYGYLAGCVANFSAVEHDGELSRKLRKLLYLNPLDTSGSTSLQSHSHSVTLTSCARNIEDITPESIDGVFHMLSNSTLSYINAQVYLLNESSRLLELIPPNKGKPSGTGPCPSTSSGYSTSPLIHLISIIAFLTRAIN